MPYGVFANEGDSEYNIGYRSMRCVPGPPVANRVGSVNGRRRRSVVGSHVEGRRRTVRVRDGRLRDVQVQVTDGVADLDRVVSHGTGRPDGGGSHTPRPVGHHLADVVIVPEKRHPSGVLTHAQTRVRNCDGRADRPTRRRYRHGSQRRKAALGERVAIGDDIDTVRATEVLRHHIVEREAAGRIRRHGADENVDRSVLAT